MWDYEAAGNNDILLSNSKTTQSRVQKYFRRDSHVLYPPIETKRFAKKLPQGTHKGMPLHFPVGQGLVPTREQSQYYIILSALTEFKKLDVAIKAFRAISDVNLLVI